MAARNGGRHRAPSPLGPSVLDGDDFLRAARERTIADHRVQTRVQTMQGPEPGPVPVKSITRADMLAYKQALLKTPNRYALRFPGLTSAYAPWVHPTDIPQLPTSGRVQWPTVAYVQRRAVPVFVQVRRPSETSAERPRQDSNLRHTV
jgi:hypothetical protein